MTQFARPTAAAADYDSTIIGALELSANLDEALAETFPASGPSPNRGGRAAEKTEETSAGRSAAPENHKSTVTRLSGANPYFCLNLRINFSAAHVFRLFSCIKGRRLTITSLIEQPFVESDVGYHHHQEVLMINKIVFLAAVGGIALATGASALPLNPIRSNNSVDQVRTVCDEYGRCWEETNPAEDIARGVIGGLEGRSMDRHRGWDHDRRYRDRDGNRDRDNDDED